MLLSKFHTLQALNLYYISKQIVNHAREANSRGYYVIRFSYAPMTACCRRHRCFGNRAKLCLALIRHCSMTSTAAKKEREGRMKDWRREKSGRDVIT